MFSYLVSPYAIGIAHPFLDTTCKVNVFKAKKQIKFKKKYNFGQKINLKALFSSKLVLFESKSLHSETNKCYIVYKGGVLYVIYIIRYAR
jgi:hypothetical protein